MREARGKAYSLNIEGLVRGVNSSEEVLISFSIIKGAVNIRAEIVISLLRIVIKIIVGGRYFMILLGARDEM